MPIYYPDILDQGTEPQQFSYTDKDVILYALGIGMGSDPLNEQELPFVYEKALQVVPTAATVLAASTRGAPLIKHGPDHRVSSTNLLLSVHGEQKIELHRPLPPTGTFTAAGRVIGVFDKGADKGAIVVNEITWTDSNGAKVATLTSSAFARGDGGFGGPAKGAPEPHIVPERAPDRTLDFSTRPDQALLYRLTGDRNPLHAEPEVARKAGFKQPILHGLSTYGVTARAVLEMIPDRDFSQLLSHQARFSAPVFPGDVLTVDLWKDGNVISFETHVKNRNVTVIKNGKTVLRG